MSKQNRSSAVMQQRSEPHDSLDDFPTPPWATRALIEHVIGDRWRSHLAVDPACNRGYMINPLQEYFLAVNGTDIFDYGCGFESADFLFPSYDLNCEWIITNPPFKLAHQFIDKALSLAEFGTAMFVRTSFVEGIDRYNNLFSVNPPAIIAHFSERVIIYKGRIMDPDRKYWHKVKGQDVFKKPSSATSYSWMVWHPSKTNVTSTVWVPPCRPLLTRPGDYDAQI